MRTAETEPGRAWRNEARPDSQHALQVLLVLLERKLGRTTLEEIEVLAGVHCKEQVDAAEAIYYRVDRLCREQPVHLVPEATAPIVEHHTELADARRFGLRGIELEFGGRDRSHRIDRVDMQKTELPQPVHDQRIRCADHVAVARHSGERSEVEVIRVAVRDDQHVDRWQSLRIDRTARARGHGAFLERIMKHRIHEAGRTLHLDQQRRVSEQRDLHGRRRRMISAAIRLPTPSAARGMQIRRACHSSSSAPSASQPPDQKSRP